ncbi:transcription-repair coupling factor [Sulfobacillus acidophilus TPY]|uniref:Transcription-repair-coupling factor n=1 Tax=Sulfobacillus acidophilus (strain ATCC 700253 / DSM 10332 / NAL) TaxID=679936 RepID=G8TWA6_SULAD|nr:transcription-repair coupling factor [Sulfobacillus acidophilus TPY]AEW03749.1 transcription-repair coupling factor [Sulfobacillus acidophilus DSM 10332]
MGELASLLELWSQYPPYQELLNRFRNGGHTVQITGLSGSLPSFMVASLTEHIQRPALVVTAGFQEARRLEAELEAYRPEAPLYLLPARPHIVGDVRAESYEWHERRLKALDEAYHNPRAVLVAPVEAVRQRVVAMAQERISLAPGQVIAPETVAEQLVHLGYVRDPEVEQEGHFAWRGAIMDVFLPGGPAVRIEWFDDEVDSVRTFDPETQRTTQMLSRVSIGPARELIWSPEVLSRALARLGQESAEVIRNLEATGHFEEARRAEERYGRYWHDLSEGRSFPGVERFMAAFAAPKALVQVFSLKPLVIFHDLPRVLEAVRGQAVEAQLERERRLERGDFLPVEAELDIPPESLLAELKGWNTVHLSLMAHGSRRDEDVFSLTGRPAPRVHGQADLLKTELTRLRKSRMKIGLVVRDEDARRLMMNHVLDSGLTPRPGLGVNGEIGVLLGTLSHGFVLPELGLALLGETELSGRDVKPETRRRREARRTIRVGDLKPGDYVVHMTHGIGRFLGVRTLDIQGQHKDYLHIQYAGADTLYVPVDQLGLVQKYVGVEGQEPRLSKMGGQEWTRTKEKVKASVREMAEELLKLYAKREAEPGIAYGPDTPWQAEFEAAFPYEETPDQLRAIDDIKRDMERARPMDRLLCGDVGYGKTEVALRAAFKAIMGGKQVAFLVPTTLLAEQHYQTAKSRLAGYPVTVEVLSRFRTPKQQKEILARVKKGQVDLLVGTHRLLAKDVQFQDLGLLIVDEEHRFGVAHKERIKALKGNVDVLTLTATPIPRTLHMALVGIRDMSVIETPPEDRLPVETVVAEYDEDLVREAIRRELDRGGQVFYVQNRIRSMDRTVEHLMKLFPGIRLAVVHGQMEENRIEDVMARFIEQEYDILVTTNIIESGLDIPNANTLIVEDADKMGLAQLYQLRGRVGRSSRLAYAYFTFHPDKVLTPAAEKRLEAIREFTELGAGYQIALRDLEIRGAGNLLGAEQHGFIATVGFDLYTQMLAQAVQELKGEPVETPVDPTIEIAVDAYLPDDYVPDPRQKIEMYKRLVSAKSLAEVEALAEEIEDRFGTAPASVTALVQLSRVRVLARDVRLTQVSHKGDRILLGGGPDSRVGPEAIQRLASRFPGRLIPGTQRAPELGIKLPPKASPDDALKTAEAVLTIMQEVSDHASAQTTHG